MKVPCPLTSTRTWLAALLSVDLILAVSGIRCLQCNSLRDRECSSGDMAAKQCAETDRYCIKYTGDSDNFVFRSCSVVVKRHCENSEVVKGVWMHVCFHTCDTDGCNTAITVTSRPRSHVLLLLTLVCVFVSSFLT